MAARDTAATAVATAVAATAVVEAAMEAAVKAAVERKEEPVCCVHVYRYGLSVRVRPECRCPA